MSGIRGHGATLSERAARLAGSTLGRLTLLGALVLAVWLGSVAAATAAGAFAHFGEAAWSGLRHLLDPGALSEDEGAVQRIVGVVQVVAGIVFLVGVVFTVLADLVDRALRRLSEVEAPVDASDHLLVIGDGAPLDALIGALPGADEPGAVDRLVVLRPPGRSLDDLPSVPVRSDVRTGNARNPDALERVSATRARAIVVLSPAVADPAEADVEALEIASVLADELGSRRKRAPLVGVQIRGMQRVEPFWDDLPPSFDAVPDDRGVGAMLALAVTHPAFADVLAGASGIDGATMPFAVPAAGLGITRFEEAIGVLGEGLPVGIIRDHHAIYVPPADAPVADRDALIVLAISGSAARRPRAAPVPLPKPEPVALGVAPVDPPRLLLVGWSAAGSSLLDELGSNSAATVLASHGPGATEELPEGRRLVPDLTDPRTLADAIEATDPSAIVVLAGANGAADPAAAYARAALNALHVCSVAPRAEVPVVVEQHSSDRARKLRQADRRIRVLSRLELSAHALLLSALDRDRLAALEAFTGDSGLTVEVVRYTGERHVALAGAYRALLAARTAPLGISRDGVPLEIADPMTAELVPGDELLTVRATRVPES